MENLGVLSSKLSFLIMPSLREAREGVCSSVCFALTIIDLKVVTREFLSLADLSGAETLRVHEPAEVVVVGEYKHLMLRPF